MVVILEAKVLGLASIDAKLAKMLCMLLYSGCSWVLNSFRADPQLLQNFITPRNVSEFNQMPHEFTQSAV